MFIPGGCYCCEPPEDPCVLSGCTWSSLTGSDTEQTGAAAYNNTLSGSTPNGQYEVTSFQNSDLGNNLPCRQIWIETVGGFGPVTNDVVYAINWIDGATHNPATQCPLTNVSFCVESKRGDDSDTNLSDGVVFVVKQNGKIYATPSQPVGVNWKRAYGTYASNNFTWINGSGGPNFTATGSTIEFGYALRLTVFANEEPFDSVLFDNVCVARTPSCGLCNTGTCDVFAGDGFTVSTTEEMPNTGNLGAVNGTYTFASSTTPVGNPSDGMLLYWDFSGTPSCVMYATVDTGVQYTHSGCNLPSNVYICTESKIEIGVGNSEYGFVNTIVQGGVHYTSSIYGLINGYQYNSDWGKITISGSQSQYKKLQFSANGLPQLVAGNPDFTQPFTIGVAAGVSSTWINGIGAAVSRDFAKIYVDNICVKVTNGACATGVSYSASVSGLSVIEKTPSCGGSWGAVAAEFSSVLSSPMVLSFYNTTTYCVWLFSYVSTANPSQAMDVGLFHKKDGTGNWSMSFVFRNLSHSTVIVASADPYECDSPLSFNGLDPDVYPAGWNPAPSCIQFDPTGISVTVTPV